MFRNAKYSFYYQSKSIICKLIGLCIFIIIVKYGIAYFDTEKYYNTHKYFNMPRAPSPFDSLHDPQEQVPESRVMHDHRPVVHFSPQSNWMNDPNGLVYYEGEWHLFYQHYPREPINKNIHWGHSVSNDLISWSDLSIALTPEDEEAGMWSGSVVIDWKNATGIHKDSGIHPMIAIYTWQKQGKQEQHMAYSVDRGRTWTKYGSNPIMPGSVTITEPNGETPAKKYVFRDPKVIFHAATASWILVLTGGDHVQFHKSTDLIHWSLLSRFGNEHGSHGGTWECPDLIEVTCTTVNRTDLWILIVSVQNNASAGGSGMQYFIGTFDGTTFQNLQTPQTINWFDYGPDSYAGTSFHNIPRFDGRKILISWMNNWQYAQHVPTAPQWRGQMTIPRQLKLDFNSFTNAYHLRQTPVHELYAYSKKLFTFHRQTLTSNILSNISCEVFMLTAELHHIKQTSVIHLRVRQSLDKAEYTEIKYTGETNQIDFDRSHSGKVDFHANFYKNFKMILDDETLKTGVLKLLVIVDRCSVEVFVNGGKYTMTGLIFPNLKSNQMELSAEGEENTLNYLELMLL